MKNHILILLILLFLPLISIAQSSSDKQIISLNDGEKPRNHIQRKQGFVIKGKQRKIKSTEEENHNLENKQYPDQQYNFETPKKVNSAKASPQVVLTKEELQTQIDIIEKHLEEYKADKSIDPSVIKKLKNTLDINKKEFQKRYCE